jgi:hypothetical protein
MSKLKIAKVSAYQQETQWSCSAATLKAAALHWGVDLTEKAIIKAVGARKGRGAETTDIVDGAKKLGFKAWEKGFKDLAEAKAMLAKGVPIIADVQSFNHKGKGHYVLIAGYKPGKGFVLMDPNTKGKTAKDNWRILSDKEMEKQWWDRAMAPPHELMPKWGVMIMPKQKEKTAFLGFKGPAPHKTTLLSDEVALVKKYHPQGLGALKERKGGFLRSSGVNHDFDVLSKALSGIPEGERVDAHYTIAGRLSNSTQPDYLMARKSKTASSPYGNALNRAKAESRAAKHAYGGKYSAGDAESMKEASVREGLKKLRILRKSSKDLTWAERKAVFGDKAKFTFGAGLGKGGHGTSKGKADLLPTAAAGAAGLAVGAGAGYAVGRPSKKKLEGQTKEANGDMMEYFQKHPKKLEEYKARQEAKEKKANDPIKKKLKVHGINIWLEWLKGEERTYYNHDPLKVNSKGKLDYKTKMKADYGYVPKRYDADGEDLDVYLGPNHESIKVFVLKQIRPSDGSFDEHKIMLGYDSIGEAKKSYLAHMPKKYLGSIRATNITAFKKEFLMGKARFQKKAATAASKAQLLGMLGGGAVGAYAGHKQRKNQAAAGVPAHKRTTGILSTGLGAWAGADLGGLISATRRMGASPTSKAVASKYLRNPMIAGGVLGGGLSAGSAAVEKKRKGKNYTGRGALAAGLEGGLHGAALGGMGGAMFSQMPGAKAKVKSKVPNWGKKSKTQKEFTKSRQAQARKHHPDLGGSAKKMSDINAEADAFMQSDAFRKMPKHATANAFADELRLIMEANARH